MPIHTTPSEKGGGLYIIWLSDTHYYGGRTSNFERRWSDHRAKLAAGVHRNAHVQAVYNIHGRVEPIVLQRLDDESLLKEAEQKWLDHHFGLPGCTNLSDSSEGGGSKGWQHTEEVKRRIGEAAVGRKHSAESVARRSDMLRGKPLGEEHKAKLSKSHTGKTLSEEARAKVAIASTGRAHTEEARKKISQARAGIVFSEETKKKMSDSRRAMLARKALATA